MSDTTESVKEPLPITHAQFRLTGLDSLPLFTARGETILASRGELFVAHVPSLVVLFPDSPVIAQWQVVEDSPVGTPDETYILWIGSHRLRLELGAKDRPEARRILRWLKETCIRMGLVLHVEQDPAPVIPF
jgi:hypothetical protein